MVYQMLEVAHSLRLASPVLLRDGKEPRYRYCPECLKAQSTPYLPIHWRIDAYRLCHIHRCFLEEECPHCAGLICPQRTWMRSGSECRGVSMASQCLACGKFLWEVSPLKIDHIDPRLMTSRDKVRLENGRAFVAALAQERVEIPLCHETGVQTGLKLVEASRLLVMGSELTVSRFRRSQGVGPMKPMRRPAQCRADQILESGLLSTELAKLTEQELAKTAVEAAFAGGAGAIPR